MIDISTLNKADVLAALYNHSKPQGLGFIQFNPKDMTRDQAEALLVNQQYFDYLYGRVMKVSILGDQLDPWLYDRDLGQGAAQRAIDSIGVK